MAILTALSDTQDWLPDYLLGVRSLLHDASGDNFSDALLCSYINDGRVQVVIGTGCLTQKLTVTLPAGQDAFQIGGVYALTNVATPVGGTAPYVLQSGAGGTATVSIATTPLTVSITEGGTYYQEPMVAFNSGNSTINIAASATSVLSGTAVSSVFVNDDTGAYAAAGVTPSVTFVPQGTPAKVQDNGSGFLELVTAGSGQRTGVVIVDAAGVVTDVPTASVSILDRRIATITQVTAVWGGLRYPLRGMAFSDISAQLRGLVGFQSIPAAFAVMGSTLYIEPVPSQELSYELNVILYPWPLKDYQTVGELNDVSARNAVKYWAAYRARLGEGDTAAAGAFLNLYQQAITTSTERYTTLLSSPWPVEED